MNIVICEDEYFWREALETLIRKWASARGIDALCTSYSSPKELVSHLKAQMQMDVLFLDISLGEKNTDGMTLAKLIRKMGNTVPLIFVTIDSMRASEGYLVEAMGFLSKPIDEPRLTLFMDRIIKQQRGQKSIKVLVDGNMCCIHEKHIIFVEIIDHIVTYHTVQGKYSYRGTLSDVMTTLSSDYFVQIHRSYVISLEKIQSIKTTYPYSVYLQKVGEIINLPVSRKYIEKFLEVYSDDILEKMI